MTGVEVWYNKVSQFPPQSGYCKVAGNETQTSTKAIIFRSFPLLIFVFLPFVINLN